MAMQNNNSLSLIRQLLESAESALASAQKLLAEMTGSSTGTQRTKESTHPTDVKGGKVIEGVFDGQNMIGPDAKTYSVPANYASKSKLVEGDSLKLTIADDGSFIYKQIGPVERRRVLGLLVRDETTDEFMVDVNGTRYKVLRASITYFKGEEGDQIVVLVPKNSESKWSAVENVIKAGATVADDILDGPAESTADEAG